MSPTHPVSSAEEIDTAALLTALRALRKGDFSARLPVKWPGMAGKIADTFNEVVELNERLARGAGAAQPGRRQGGQDHPARHASRR